MRCAPGSTRRKSTVKAPNMDPKHQTSPSEGGCAGLERKWSRALVCSICRAVQPQLLLCPSRDRHCVLLQACIPHVDLA
jgi:hypothetical protein